MEIKTKAGRVEIRCYYDDQDPQNCGWYARFSYFRPDAQYPEKTDDTMKIWSVDMPRRRDAEKLAMRRARGYARRMLAGVV